MISFLIKVFPASVTPDRACPGFDPGIRGPDVPFKNALCVTGALIVRTVPSLWMPELPYSRYRVW